MDTIINLLIGMSIVFTILIAVIRSDLLELIRTIKTIEEKIDKEKTDENRKTKRNR